MYHEHFGLERSLFDEGIAQDAAVFFAGPHERAAATLKVALTSRDSAAVLVGPAGIGKTTIASHTLRAMTTRLALGWLGSAPLTSHELLEMLLTEYGFTPYKHSRVERLQMWRQFLAEMSLTETRVCILVENADSYAPEVLAALESMTAADPTGCPGANIVLTSRGPLAELFANPLLAPLRQRTRMQQRLEPLDQADLRRYLAHCAKTAGGDYGRIFAPDAAEALHTYSGGVIRVANNLCETTLTMAADAGCKRLGGELVARTATDVFGIAPAGAASLAPGPRASSESPAAVPPSPLLEQADEVPVLTMSVENDGLDLDLDMGFDMDIEIEMDQAQIDDVLRNDVPTLTDAVDLSADELDAGASMRVGLDQNTQDELAGLEAAAHAKTLEDISNSMAENVFGSAELEQLAATLALATGSHKPEDAERDRKTDQRAAPRAAFRA
jgi:general secretion pathway protein A